MQDPKLVTFSAAFTENAAELSAENPDAIKAVSVDGYPDEKDGQGASVCKIYITRRGDMITHWNLRQYQDHPDVKELIAGAKARLKAAWQYRPGEADPPKIQIIVREGVFSDIRLPVSLKLDIEVIQVDPDYADYDKLREYEDAVYEDETMYSADVRNINFEDQADTQD